MLRFIIYSFSQRAENSVVYVDVLDAVKSMGAESIYRSLLHEMMDKYRERGIHFIIVE